MDSVLRTDDHRWLDGLNHCMDESLALWHLHWLFYTSVLD